MPSTTGSSLRANLSRPGLIHSSSKFAEAFLATRIKLDEQQKFEKDQEEEEVAQEKDDWGQSGGGGGDCHHDATSEDSQSASPLHSLVFSTVS